MFSKAIFLPTMLLLATLIAGCDQPPGNLLVKYEGGTLVRTTEAPERGRYALFAKEQHSPDVTYSLNKGDKLGFVEKNGKVYAVAGDHEDGLKPKTIYYWRMIEE